MSKLIVEVCKIEEIQNHPNADRLDVVRIKGWWSIVSRNQYKVGDLVVFIPPDAVLPNEMIEEFKLDFVRKGGRVKTCKLRGFISQGLILSTNILSGKWKEGENVANALGIKKYEPPVSKTCNLNGGRQVTKKKLNPLFDKYTDIDNIKNYNTVFTTDDRVIITEKIHGTNFRAGNLPVYSRTIIGWIKKYLLRKDYEFCYGSHNVQKKPFSRNKGWYGDDVYGRIAKKYDLANVLPKDYILYGEIYGHKIQELTYGMDDIDLVVFDIKKNGKYLDFDEVVMFCRENKIPNVPIIYVGEFNQDILNQSTNCTSRLAQEKGITQIAEGCVVKCVIDEMHPRVGRKILKSISSDYLLTKNRTEYH